MEFWLFDQAANQRQILRVDVDPILIGRDDQADIALRGAFVAKKHARLHRRGNQFFLENLSRSGTRVANRDIPAGRETRVDFGDEIQIAQYSLALVRPDGQTDTDEKQRALQQRVVEIERQVHAELIERMNLRVNTTLNKSDRAYRSQIVEQLREILNERVNAMDKPVMLHIVREQLHRMTIAEVVRQGQGRVQTEYRPADAAAVDPMRESETTELVASIVDTMPLRFDPVAVTEDLEVAEESFDDLFEQVLPTIDKPLATYLVRQTLSKHIQDIMFGLGPLQDLLEMANVSEIMVVGHDRVYVEKNGVVQPTTRTFFSDEILMSVIERILSPIGRRVDHSTPLVDARLHDGSRVNVIIPPLSLVGPCLTIRKFGWVPFTMDDLIERDAISPQGAEFLKACVVGRKNIVVSGGTGSGKTTLLNTLCAFARPTERVITIEESAELRLPQPHVVGLEARPANVEGRGAYTIRELVRNALRMRPDRIIVGEVRGPEALDMLQAMNTGHDGSLSTLHANSPSEATQRLETLVLLAVDIPVRAVREQIVSAVDLIVQVARLGSGRRRVTRISEVVEIDPGEGTVRVEDVFVLPEPDAPRLRHSGHIPAFVPEMIERDMMDVTVFT